MFQWFANLPPGEQITIVVLLVSSAFNSGVFYASTRWLRSLVKKIEAKLERHEERLEQHSAQIERLDERTKVSAR